MLNSLATAVDRGRYTQSRPVRLHTNLACVWFCTLVLTSLDELYPVVRTLKALSPMCCADMLHRWTNGRFLSTLHRVEKRSPGERYSTPFFCAPNWDAKVGIYKTSTPNFCSISCSVPVLQCMPSANILRLKIFKI